MNSFWPPVSFVFCPRWAEMVRLSQSNAPFHPWQRRKEHLFFWVSCPSRLSQFCSVWQSNLDLKLIFFPPSYPLAPVIYHIPNQPTTLLYIYIYTYTHCSVYVSYLYTYYKYTYHPCRSPRRRQLVHIHYVSVFWYVSHLIGISMCICLLLYSNM